MAELALFSLCGKLLSTIASPVMKKAYEKGLSIWEAKDELDKLQVTMTTIQAVLLDAEKKQEGSATIQDWMKRLKDVLYDADDLFDAVATDELLKQQIIKDNKKHFLKKQVHVSCSKLNPVMSRNSIAKKVKAIRESLDDISKDMARFNFVTCLKEEPMFEIRRGQDPGCYVDCKTVIGRDKDKKAILEMLVKESDNVPAIIAVVGIGGMGKTTLAQLVYNNEEVTFEKRWFACISDTSDEKEVIGKIFQSISGQNYDSFSVGQLQQKIIESIVGKKFLLVLDDVWDDDRGRWLDRISLLRGGAKGSKVVVTTRSPLVAMVVGGVETHNLEGLSDDDSWDLFKRFAFESGDENDPRREIVGREIVKKCRNVPLAIRSIASLLFEKHTILEWESFKNQELSKLDEQRSAQDSIMPVLKVSYHHLPSNLKHCFAYCSLFPEDFHFSVQKLTNLWISQGYIKPHLDSETLEQASRSYFMHLLRRGFFQVKATIETGEVLICKMHDLIHDLARHVAGEERKMLTSTSWNASNCARHVSLSDSIDNTWVIPTQLGNSNKLRSLLFMKGGILCSSNLDQLCAKFKLLRSLNLWGLKIESVPSCIGELKHLRYLDLSGNKFESLPDSMTNLLNLLTLNLNGCSKLKALPDNLRKLINLRCLTIIGCDRLKHMPVGIGELTCLQHLSDFKVGKAASEEDGVKNRSGLDALAGLDLKGGLSIDFEDWDGGECSWQLPVSLEALYILNYPGKSMNGRTNNLASLSLRSCSNVINLPLLSCLANLRSLHFDALSDLEFVEESSSNSCMAVAGSPFFPRLEVLSLINLPKLKGWWRRATPTSTSTSTSTLTSTSTSTTSSPLFPSFPALCQLTIKDCPELESIPLCPRLRILDFGINGGNGVIEQVLSSPASTTPPSSSCFREILISPHLQQVNIFDCSLEILHVTPPQLLRLHISDLRRLKKLHIARPNVLEELIIHCCPELELWEEDKRGVDWDSLSNIRHLWLNERPPPEKLPQCLRHRQALGQLGIVGKDINLTNAREFGEDI